MGNSSALDVNTNTMRHYWFFICFILLNVSCSNNAVDTSDSQEAYRLWAGESAPKNIRVLHGRYWRSPHWSYEFEVFLHIRASMDWKARFKEENNLQESLQLLELPNNTPNWFKLDPGAALFSPNGTNTGPFYFENPGNDEVYIYEVQF